MIKLILTLHRHFMDLICPGTSLIFGEFSRLKVY
jgi:hypothetical protein